MPTILRIVSLEVEPRAERVRCTDDELIVILTDGRTLYVPLAWFPRLAGATAEQRADYELLGEGSGIHWDAIDEDISVIGLLAGTPSMESAHAGKAPPPFTRGTRSG